MTFIRSVTITFGTCESLAFAMAANAALVDRGGGLIFDNDRNITWLENANLADTNDFGVTGINASGSMTWAKAIEWIAAMNTASYLGYDNWRLPTTPFTDMRGPCATATSERFRRRAPHGCSARGFSPSPQERDDGRFPAASESSINPVLA